MELIGGKLHAHALAHIDVLGSIAKGSESSGSRSGLRATLQTKLHLREHCRDTPSRDRSAHCRAGAQVDCLTPHGVTGEAGGTCKVPISADSVACAPCIQYRVHTRELVRWRTVVVVSTTAGTNTRRRSKLTKRLQLHAALRGKSQHWLPSW